MAQTFFMSGTLVTSDFLNDVQKAENISVVPATGITSTNVQDALEEIASSITPDVDASVVTYTPTGTGAEATTVEKVLQQFRSVKDFGAVGDGVVDDTTAIQEALTAGGTVLFPAGTYRITSSLNIPANTIMQGQGRANSIIKVDGAFIGATRIYASKAPTNVMKIEVRGLGFQGTATALGALHFDKGDVVTIDSCDFFDFTATGGFGVKLTNVYFWQVSHCKFENIKAVGLSLISAGGVGCNAGVCGPNNDFIGNNQALFIGTAFDRGQNILVYSNDYEGSGNGNKAIDLNGVEGVYILQNYIELWQNAAIAANSGLGNKRVTLEQNVINANSAQVCNFNDTTVANDRITFRANRFADTTAGQTGVFFGNSLNVVFVDNDPGASVPSDRYTSSPRTVQALVGSTTWDPGAIPDGSASEITFTVPGAAVGDVCSVSLSTIGSRNMLITGHVSAANTVRVVLFNKEGAAVDLPSGTATAWVFKA